MDGWQVRQLQEVAAQLQTVYAGENADAIATKEQEVMRSWKELLSSCEDCRLQVTTTADKIRFLNLVRDLISWMDILLCQIGAGEKPRYCQGQGESPRPALLRRSGASSSWPFRSLHAISVCRDASTVEVLMSDHQGLKGEIEARSKSISACVDLGKTLVLNRSPASEEVSLAQGPSQSWQTGGPTVCGGREDPPDLAPGVLGGFSTQGLTWLLRLRNRFVRGFPQVRR